MKKVGIITILKVNNYGAELQAFALRKKLEQMGYDSEIIDYLYYTNPEHKPTRGSVRVMQISLKNKLKWEGHKLLNFIKKLKTTSQKTQKFLDFHAKYTKLSPTFRTYEELYRSDLAYDVFMVGSDQVWNPITHTSIKPYFLTFVKDGKKKVSYASSFGVSEIAPENKASYKELLNNMDVLSSREQLGVSMIKELTGRDAVHVLDPTLLLTRSDWDSIATESFDNEPYILLYVLRFSPYLQELTKYFRDKFGYKVLNIGPLIEEENVKNITDAGPCDFVGYFKNASYVLTDSYHGTIFSIIYHKQFFTIIPSRKTNNSRQRGLLDMLGLSERLLNENADYPKPENSNINYEKVEDIIKEQRKKSMDYLIHAIGE